MNTNVREAAKQLWSEVRNRSKKLKWFPNESLEATGSELVNDFHIKITLTGWWGESQTTLNNCNFEVLIFSINIVNSIFEKSYPWDRIDDETKKFFCDILIGDRAIIALTDQDKLLREIAKWYIQYQGK